MQISISGKQIDIGKALQEHVEERLERGVHKYFERAVHADVVFSRESHEFRADVIVNEGTGKGTVIKSKASSTDVYAAFDLAVVRIEKQLRRYKRRLKNHHHTSKGMDELLEAPETRKGKKYVLSAVEGEEASESTSDEDLPLIVAEKSTEIELLSVSEAVMRMDLAQLPALLFINKVNNRVNVVYHRADGNIAWVDPEASADEKISAA